MQVSWVIVSVSAAAAFWSPFAAAACVFATLMGTSPFWARAVAGSSIATTMHKAKCMTNLHFGFRVTHKAMDWMQSACTESSCITQVLAYPSL